MSEWTPQEVADRKDYLRQVGLALRMITRQADVQSAAMMRRHRDLVADGYGLPGTITAIKILEAEGKWAA